MFASNRSQLPSGIWLLGFVSLLMDISSEMIRSLLPLFLVTAFGDYCADDRADRGAGRSNRSDRQSVFGRAE